jgi:hypothetical protein
LELNANQKDEVRVAAPRPRRYWRWFLFAVLGIALLEIAVTNVVDFSRRADTRSVFKDVCIPYPRSQLVGLADGLLSDNLRIANAWVVASTARIDAINIYLPAYFVSADIIGPRGDAVVGTWLTDGVSRSTTMASVSASADKYTDWGMVGDRSTVGIGMATDGAKESVLCVLRNRPKGST